MHAAPVETRCIQVPLLAPAKKTFHGLQDEYLLLFDRARERLAKTSVADLLKRHPPTDADESPDPKAGLWGHLASICATMDPEGLRAAAWLERLRGWAPDAPSGTPPAAFLCATIEGAVARLCRITHQNSKEESTSDETAGSVLLEAWVWTVEILQPFAATIPVKRPRMLLAVLDEVERTLSRSVFDLMVAWPRSRAAFCDLRFLLRQRSPSGTPFVGHLAEAMADRLLHSGVPTREILDFYISSIRTMRMLDPTFAGFDRAMAPVQAYLRGRPDAIRLIVALLLSGQVHAIEAGWRGSAKVDAKTAAGIAVEQPEFDAAGAAQWQPQSRAELSLLDGSGGRLPAGPIRGRDIVSQLVNIYTSRDVFIAAFQELLAERLMRASATRSSEDAAVQTAHIESLKGLFGDAALQMCDVMLQDIYTSHALDAEIRRDVGGGGAPLPLHALVLSRQFWPAFDVLDSPYLRLPDEMVRWLGVYQDWFGQLKPDRRLAWLPHLGQVELEIELDGGATVSAVCTPVQAAVLAQFERQREWSVDALARAAVLTVGTARAALQFWAGTHVLREDSRRGVYSLVDGPEPVAAPLSSLASAGDDAAALLDADSDDSGSDREGDRAAEDAPAAPAGPGRGGRALNPNEQRMLSMVVTNMIRNLGPIDAPEICRRTSAVLPMFACLRAEHITAVARELVSRGTVVATPDGRYQPAVRSQFS